MSGDDVDDGGGRPGRSTEGFHHRVLEAAQAATVVVDRQGVITWASRGALDLFGYPADELVGHNMVEFIDPTDLEEMVTAFSSVLDDEGRWPPALIGLVAADGSVVPAEVAGHGRFDDPVIGGAVYSIHRMDETMLLHRILAALATAEPLGEVLRHVTAMVAVPPLVLDAVVGYDAADGGFHAMAAGLLPEPVAEALTADDPDLPWTPAALAPLPRQDTPTLTMVADLPDPVGAALVEAGYLECWVAPLVLEGDRVVGALTALTRQTTLPGATIRQRMRRARDVAELAFIRRDYEEQLRHAAMHDRLTQIPNRARFFDALEHGVGQRGGPLTGVLYLDLDGFKPLNDAHGHAFGDQVLVEVARRIDGALRPHDLAARLGGDEFAVLLEGLEHEEAARRLGERLCSVVAAPIVIDGIEATVGVSVGVAVGPSTGDRATLLNAADQAMYEAKRAGKGAVRVARL